MKIWKKYINLISKFEKVLKVEISESKIISYENNIIWMFRMMTIYIKMQEYFTLERKKKESLLP